MGYKSSPQVSLFLVSGEATQFHLCLQYSSQSPAKTAVPLQVLYALTAGVAGYVAAVTYKILGGTSWVRNTLLTATLFCGPLLVTFSFLNTVAIIYRSTAALPFGTIVIIFIIWAVVTFPLTVLGGIAGKNTKVCWNEKNLTSILLRQFLGPTHFSFLPDFHTPQHSV